MNLTAENSLSKNNTDCTVLCCFHSPRYESVESERLFGAFEFTLADFRYDFGDVSVTDFMKQWTEQAGYPVINVTRDDHGAFIVTQVCIGNLTRVVVISAPGRFLGAFPDRHARQSPGRVRVVRGDYIYDGNGEKF